MYFALFLDLNTLFVAAGIERQPMTLVEKFCMGEPSTPCVSPAKLPNVVSYFKGMLHSEPSERGGANWLARSRFNPRFFRLKGLPLKELTLHFNC